MALTWNCRTVAEAHQGGGGRRAKEVSRARRNFVRRRPAAPENALVPLLLFYLPSFLGFAQGWHSPPPRRGDLWPLNPAKINSVLEEVFAIIMRF